MSLADPAAVIDFDLRPDLERVEDILRAAVASDRPLVRQAGGYLLAAGGKRLRPVLVLLAGRLGPEGDAADPAPRPPSPPRAAPGAGPAGGDGDRGTSTDRLVACAAAIELTHLATLYHDDVIDEAAVRRGTPSANVRYDNTVAVLTGDWLFARASGIAADLGPYVSRVLADTIARLCEGQIMESEISGRLDGTADEYLEVIRRKTAALMAASCHLGAWLAGAPATAVEAATAYGEALGISFQVADDVLDIAGVAEESGKVPGTDLREGVYTLPVLETLAGAVPGGEPLRGALAAGDVEAALHLLRSNGSLDLARRVAAAWQERARESLASVHEGAARDALAAVAGFAADRRT